MDSKVALFLISNLLFSLSCFSQQTSFSIEAQTTYDFLSYSDRPVTPLPSNFGFTANSLTRASLIEPKKQGNLGGRIMLKLGLQLTNRLAYKAGFGLNVQQDKFFYEQRLLNVFDANGILIASIFEGTLGQIFDTTGLNIPGGPIILEGDDINYRWNVISTTNYTTTFWQFKITPIELEYELIKDLISCPFLLQLEVGMQLLNLTQIMIL